MAALRSIRERWHGPYIANGAYDAARGAEAVASGWATAVAYGVPFLANPDLPLRFLTGGELNAADKATFYGGDAKGLCRLPGRWPRSGSRPDQASHQPCAAAAPRPCRA